MTDWDTREHKSIGDNIDYHGYGVFVGWTPVPPQVGDRILTRLKSGRIGALTITDVRCERDPDDMWWATIDLDSLEIQESTESS